VSSACKELEEFSTGFGLLKHDQRCMPRKVGHGATMRFNPGTQPRPLRRWSAVPPPNCPFHLVLTAKLLKWRPGLASHRHAARLAASRRVTNWKG
jgi:hypothetical protein